MSHLKAQIAGARRKGDTRAVARMEAGERAEAHPGFDVMQRSIASREDPRRPGKKIGMKRAGAILAAHSKKVK